MRHCTRCDANLTQEDLSFAETRGMEADRRRHGLEGVRFLYFTCPDCGHADIFIDLHRLPRETFEEFSHRRAGLEAVVREMHADQVGLVLTSH